jgi:hypothetical protein
MSLAKKQYTRKHTWPCIEGKCLKEDKMSTVEAFLHHSYPAFRKEILIKPTQTILNEINMWQNLKTP